MEPIPLARTYLDEEIRAATIQVLESGRWIKGPESIAFGEEWANWCGALSGTPTSNGSTALIAALRLLNVGPGDEVIVPSLTFISSATCINQVGATPIFVDIEPEFYTMSPRAVISAISPSTKAIIAVHLFGQPVHPEIFDLGIPVIEDAAQAHGAELNNQRVGSIGDLATFSFFPSKNLAVGGDGGAILANTNELSSSISAAVNHGLNEAGGYNFLSSNYRLSEIQCAIGRIQLKHLEDWCARRRQIAERYSKAFDNSMLPIVREDCKHAWNQYVLKTKDAAGLVAHLQTHNIASTIHYPIPCHLQPLYATHPQHAAGSVPITEEICNQLVSIPVFPQLTDEEVDRIITAVNSW